MKKKWSQRLLLICAVWQFIDGILTIILGFAGPNRIPELQGYASLYRWQQLPVWWVPHFC